MPPLTAKDPADASWAHAKEFYRVEPALDHLRSVTFSLEGEIGRRLNAVTEQWILPAPHSNPGMLTMFRDRDRRPLRDMVAWAGEYAGKYLTHAAAIFKLTGKPDLEKHLRWFVDELIEGQDEDGYLGPWPKPFRWGLTGITPNCSNGNGFGAAVPWDTWGHYHTMLGLLQWHDSTGDQKALQAVCRIGDCLCTTFLNAERRVHEVGELSTAFVPYHSLLLLFARTGKARYFELAEEIERDFEIPAAGDYLRTALAGREFHELPQPRWESVHPIQGFAEKFLVTGDSKYRQAFTHFWWSIVKGDRHNNGGFTTGERATGDPCQQGGAIESCATVGWAAMSVDMLRLTGHSVVADELELTLFNSGLGMMTPSGRWVTYDTPMDGRRWASSHSSVTHARPGAPELNCCAVNGPRVLGLLSDWALLRHREGLALNYYGPGTINCQLPSGSTCSLTQITDYPRQSLVEIRMGLDTTEEFPLSLRIPYWSESTSVTVAGQRFRPTAGQYLTLTRTWQPGDTIVIDFDFRPHFWAREEAHFYTDWETEWHVAGPLFLPASEDRGTLLKNWDGRLPATSMTNSQGLLEFAKQLRSRETGQTMLLFTELESVEDAILPIRFSADWWSTITVNGEIVFDGESTQFEDSTLRLYKLNLPLRRGKNRIGWAVMRHSNHVYWNMTVGRALTEKDNAFRLASIYRGPILLAFDHRFNAMDIENVPGLDASDLHTEVVDENTSPAPWLLVECRDTTGQMLRLCDFASAGSTGNPYRSWLNVRNVKPTHYSETNPLRTSRCGSVK